MNILATSAFLPRADKASGDQRFLRLLALLARRGSLDYAAQHAPTADPIALRDLEAAGARVVATEYEGFRRALGARPYGLILCEFWDAAREMGPLIRRRQPWAKFVVDSVDVHYLREASAIRLGFAEAEAVARRKAAELAVYREADATIVVTEEERRALAGEGGVRQVIVIPNIVHVAPPGARTRAPNLLFVGGFLHPPNRDGILWFTTEILPRIREAIPEATLTVIGSHAPPEVLALADQPGVHLVGYVPDLDPWYARMAVSVAPLRYGGGMKGKVTEAMARGLPVVTTSFGAQGLGAMARDSLRVADPPEAFAEAVIGLLRDPAAADRQTQVAREAIDALCGPARVNQALDALVIRDGWRAPRNAALRLGWFRATNQARRLLKRVFRRPGASGPAVVS